MGDDVLYEVLSPEGRRMASVVKSTGALADLNDAVVGQVWDYMFRGDEIFAHLREELRLLFPKMQFVDFEAFGNIHGPQQDALTAAIPRTLSEHGCNAVIVGIGA